MAEPIKIPTGKNIKSGKVDIDGNIWDVVLPGAATELRISQMQKQASLYEARSALIEKKIDAGTATEADLDKYEEYIAKTNQSEQYFYDMMLQVFKDGTKDNKSVKKWLEETPTVYIMMAFEDVKNKASDDGRTESTGSTG